MSRIIDDGEYVRHSVEEQCARDYVELRQTDKKSNKPLQSIQLHKYMFERKKRLLV
jgi:hypothetical protein